MKRKGLVSAAVLPVLLACGCSSLTHTENGALAGGAIGAGTGALVGSTTGHTGGGALLGGAIGALSGGLIGSAVDKSERRADAQLAAAQARSPLGLTEVAQMAQQHISDEVIIGQIRTTGAVYHLSPSDIYWLKQNGVNDRVIQEMQATAARAPRRVYTATPVYPAPVYVVPPPPPVRVGVGFGFSHCGH
jgi:hypothetical protein